MVWGFALAEPPLKGKGKRERGGNLRSGLCLVPGSWMGGGVSVCSGHVDERGTAIVQGGGFFVVYGTSYNSIAVARSYSMYVCVHELT